MGTRLKGNVGPSLPYPGVSKTAIILFLVATIFLIFVMLGFSVNYIHRSINDYCVLFEIFIMFACLCAGHLIHRLFLIWRENVCITQAVDYAFGGLTEDFYVLSVAEVLCALKKESLSTELLVCCGACAAVGFLHHFLGSFSYSDKKQIAEKNELNIGYGLAYFYYHNYLYFIMDSFQQRVREFSMEQGISVFEKLMILVPRSCKVKKFIDDNPRRTMRVRELPPMKINVASTRGRVYNITVYELFPDGDSVRYFAIEYAQPLRQLHALLEKKKITEKQMQDERTAFVCNLEIFLRAGKDSFRSCALVQCDDNFDKIVNTLTDIADR